MSEWNCSRCGKDLHGAMRKGSAAYPIDPKGTQNRRWVCGNCINRNEISDDILDVTNDISEGLNGKSIVTKRTDG